MLCIEYNLSQCSVLTDFHPPVSDDDDESIRLGLLFQLIGCPCAELVRHIPGREV
jgi:hypothetical protein